MLYWKSQLVAGGLRSLFFSVATQKVAANLRNKLYVKILEQDVNFFDRCRVGDLSARLNVDVNMMVRHTEVQIRVGQCVAGRWLPCDRDCSSCSHTDLLWLVQWRCELCSSYSTRNAQLINLVAGAFGLLGDYPSLRRLSFVLYCL